MCRYADVVVHRLLAASVQGIRYTDDISEMEQKFSDIANHCNDKKMSAKNAEEDCDRVFLCIYLQTHPIETTGVVIGVGEKSFTIYVEKFGLEKRLFLTKLGLRGEYQSQKKILALGLPKGGILSLVFLIYFSRSVICI